MNNEECPECGTRGYLVLPSYGQHHTEDCKKIQKKLRGIGACPPFCTCPYCQTCLKLRLDKMSY